MNLEPRTGGGTRGWCAPQLLYMYILGAAFESHNKLTQHESDPKARQKRIRISKRRCIQPDNSTRSTLLSRASFYFVPNFTLESNNDSICQQANRHFFSWLWGSTVSAWHTAVLMTTVSRMYRFWTVILLFHIISISFFILFLLSEVWQS